MTIDIVEIMGRAKQGVTKPFICRGEDGHVYFVNVWSELQLAIEPG